MKYRDEQDIIARVKENKDWYNKSYAGYFFGIFEQASAIGEATDNPLAMPYGLLFHNWSRPHHMDWFWDNVEMRSKRAVVLERAVTEPQFADNFLKTWQADYDKFLLAFEQSQDLDLATADNQTIKEALTAVHLSLKKHAHLAYIVDVFLTDDKEDWLVEAIKSELGDGASNEVVAALTSPVYNSFVNDFDIGKYELAGRVGEQSEAAVRQGSADLAQQFFWLHTNYYDHLDLTGEAVYQEVLALSKLPNIRELYLERREAAASHREKKDKLYRELNVSSKLQAIVHISEIFTHIQDKRKEGVLRSNNFFFKILEKIAVQEKQDRITAYYLIIDEAIAYFCGVAIDWPKIIKRRDTTTVSFFVNRQSKIYFLTEIKDQLTLPNLFPEIEQVTEIKGSTAFRGQVTGTVQILRHSGDIAAFQEGNILIANQTTPEFVPAMKKALAIITDQGGITCHAAIVARELQKPCIIGTKIATKVLKDGDVVEVDAEKGIIRIIK